MTVDSVEALIAALIPQLVSDVIEVNIVSFQVCCRFQNAAKNGRVRLTKSRAPMGKKDKFDLNGHLVRFIWYVFLGTATIQVTEHIKAFMVKTPTHQFQKRIIFMSMFNDTERDELVTGGRFAMSKKAKHKHIATTSRDAGFAAVVGGGQHFVTKPSVLTEDGDLVSICRAYIRDRREVEPICGIQDDVRIGLVPFVVVTHTYTDFISLIQTTLWTMLVGGH